MTESDLAVSNVVRLDTQSLFKKISQLCCSSGLAQSDAEILADCLIEADRCGVTTHGLITLKAHLNRLKEGTYNTAPHISIVREGLAFAVLDADNAVGMISAKTAADLAMQRSRNTGIFMVLSQNSNTYGPAFYFPLLAARQGLIGITFCNSPAAMPVAGGRSPMLGTNPLAFAIPSASNDPIIFDMATSKVAKSKINLARLKNETIPEGWALNSEGEPTTDPLEAIRGLVLPMEGYKGYGLALMIDLIAGLLSGAATLNDVGKFYTAQGSMNVGQAFIAMDPQVIFGPGFAESVDHYVSKIRQSPAAANHEISLPGDRKNRSAQDCRLNGVALDKTVVSDINDLLVSHQIKPLVCLHEDTANE